MKKVLTYDCQVFELNIKVTIISLWHWTIPRLLWLQKKKNSDATHERGDQSLEVFFIAFPCIFWRFAKCIFRHRLLRIEQVGGPSRSFMLSQSHLKLQQVFCEVDRVKVGKGSTNPRGYILRCLAGRIFEVHCRSKNTHVKWVTGKSLITS